MHAPEIASGDRQIARLLGAAGKHDGVVTVDEFLRFEINADVHVAMEGDAFRFHLVDAALDVDFLHLEVGDAIAQQAAGLRMSFKDVHIVAGAGELLCAGQAGGA